MNSTVQNGIFATYDPQYEAAGFDTIPVKSGKKQPAVSGWQEKRSLPPEDRAQLRRTYSQSSIGLLSGTALSTELMLVFLDVDHDGFVPFVRALIGNPACAKRAAKGQTIICQAAPELKSAKLRPKGARAPVVEVMADTGMTVLPPSRHPNGGSYEWIGKPLLEVPHSELPVLDQVRFEIISLVAKSPHALQIAEGGPDVKAHDLMLSLTSSGIAQLTDNLEWLADCLNALFHPKYRGNTKSETLGMLRTAQEKGLGAVRVHRAYDPGSEGPVPLGFTKEGLYAFHDPVRRIIIQSSANQLLSPQHLIGLAPSAFWAARFPARKPCSVPTLLAKRSWKLAGRRGRSIRSQPVGEVFGSRTTG